MERKVLEVDKTTLLYIYPSQRLCQDNFGPLFRNGNGKGMDHERRTHRRAHGSVDATAGLHARLSPTSGLNPPKADLRTPRQRAESDT